MVVVVVVVVAAVALVTVEVVVIVVAVVGNGSNNSFRSSCYRSNSNSDRVRFSNLTVLVEIFMTVIESVLQLQE